MTWGVRTVEIIRALAALALVCLNFAHAPLASAEAPGELFLAPPDATSFCGAPVGDEADHAPCHACRIGGSADLPPASPAVVYARGTVAAAFAVAPSNAPVAAPIPRLGARAPPAH